MGRRRIPGTKRGGTHNSCNPGTTLQVPLPSFLSSCNHVPTLRTPHPSLAILARRGTRAQIQVMTTLSQRVPPPTRRLMPLPAHRQRLCYRCRLTALGQPSLLPVLPECNFVWVYASFILFLFLVQLGLCCCLFPISEFMTCNWVYRYNIVWCFTVSLIKHWYDFRTTSMKLVTAALTSQTLKPCDWWRHESGDIPWHASIISGAGGTYGSPMICYVFPLYLPSV